MTPEKREAIESAGFKVTTVKEFLELTEEEDRAIEENIASRGAHPTKTYGFTIILAGVTIMPLSALFESGCNDATVSTRDGVTFVHFDRKAASLGDAIASAVKDVERAGLEVAMVTFISVSMPLTCTDSAPLV